MGGKALRNCKTRRVDRVEYEEISSVVLAIISNYFNLVGVPKFLATKLDFGDVDVLVAGQKDPQMDRKALRHAIFGDLNSLEMVNNGPVDSFEFRNFQIDLIEVPTESFSAALQFLSWGDLGMLVGVTANSLGLTYGETGLSLQVYAEPPRLEELSTVEDVLSTPVPPPCFYREVLSKSDQNTLRLGLIGKVSLTNDMNDVYSFLGFHCSTDVSKLHFTSEDEIFQFIIDSDYFDPEAYGVVTGSEGGETVSVPLDSAKDGRYDLYNIDPSRLNKKYRDRLFKRPVFSHFLRKICQETNLARLDSDELPPCPPVCDDYDVAEMTDKRSRRRNFHRTRALDKYAKWAEYEHIIKLERLRKLSRDLSPSCDWLSKEVGLEGPKLGKWLQKFKTAMAAKTDDGIGQDWSEFPELSVWERWTLAQNSTDAIKLHMSTYSTR